MELVITPSSAVQAACLILQVAICGDCHTPKPGVDTVDFLTTIRLSGTGPRPRIGVFAGPSFSLSLADHLSQPRAGVRTCRVPRLLRGSNDGRCNGGSEPT